MSTASRQDLFIFLILMGLSATLLWWGQNLSLGTAARMSAGYFPRMIAVGSAALAIIVLARIAARHVLKRADTEVVPAVPVHWRALISVALSLVTFALLIRPAGLITAALIAVLTCTVAQTYRSLTERLVLASGLAASAGLVFVNALGLPFQLFPSF